MSRGPGRIERDIRALFDLHPDLAFSTDELAEHCFKVNVAERKHRVSVLRAAHSVVSTDPNWRLIRGLGNHGAFVNMDSLQSYGLGKSFDPNAFKWLRTRYSVKRPRDSLEERLATLEREPHRTRMMPPDGEWVREVLWHRAERDGDVEVASRFRAEHQAKFAAAMAMVRACQ